jgi:hypothetical protein
MDDEIDGISSTNPDYYDEARQRAQSHLTMSTPGPSDRCYYDDNRDEPVPSSSVLSDSQEIDSLLNHTFTTSNRDNACGAYVASTMGAHTRLCMHSEAHLIHPRCADIRCNHVRSGHVLGSACSLMCCDCMSFRES